MKKTFKETKQKANKLTEKYSLDNCIYSNKTNMILFLPVKLRKRKNNKCYQGCSKVAILMTY